MLPTGTPVDWAQVEVAVPRHPARLPGISMAGFRPRRIPAPMEIAVVPHPAVTVIVDLSEGAGLRYDVRGRPARGSVVAGLLPGDVRAGGWDGECLQIRVAPIAAGAVLGASTALTGSVVSLEDVWGRDAGRIEERLRAAPSWEERFAIAEGVLRRRLGAGPPVGPEVAYAWRRMLASRGRVRVDGLADEVGWSRKRLWSRFRSHLGITPKRAVQLVRFDHAAHLLAAGRAAADVAAESGYVDQSHLHRDVRALTGTTPSIVAAAPWLAIDDVAWPVSSTT